MKVVLPFIFGLLAAAGLCISGMARPTKVLGFLDLGGSFDPSLALVMIGAIPVHALVWWQLRRRQTPLLGGTLPPPAPKAIDAKLIGGSVLFGAGWGLGGVCPGPALVAAPAITGVLVLLGSMLAAMAVVERLKSRQQEAAAAVILAGAHDR